MTHNADTPMPHTIILAGGFGTRLRPRLSDKPKVLAPIAGVPFITYQLNWLKAQGVRKATIAVHYLANQIQQFVDEWKDERFNLDCVYESEPLGTGGAVANVIRQRNLKESVIVINGDTIFRFNLSLVVERMKAVNTSALLVAAPQDNVARFGTISIKDSIVKSFHQASGIHKPGIVNGGVYILKTCLFGNLNVHKFSLEYDLFPKLASDGKLNAYLLNEKEGFFDIGTLESFDQICQGNEVW